MKNEPHISFTRLETDALQFRPRGSTPDTPYYAPERDVAHLSDKLIRTVYADLVHGDWFADECEIAGVTKEQVVPALQAIHRMVHENGLGADRLEELKSNAGIDFIDPHAMQVAFAMCGEAFMAAAWRGKRAATQMLPDGTLVSKTETGEETARAAMDMVNTLWGKRTIRWLIKALLRKWLTFLLKRKKAE